MRVIARGDESVKSCISGQRGEEQGDSRAVLNLSVRSSGAEAHSSSNDQKSEMVSCWKEGGEELEVLKENM